MSLPVPPNTTCDVYQNPNAPPNPPDVVGVVCYLEERFRNIKPPGGSPSIDYDHIMRVLPTTDIRDGYNGVPGPSLVFVPNKGGTRFLVVAVARVARGTTMDHKICYLQRTALTWPSNDV